MPNARCVATGDPPFFINSSTIKARCSPNHTMIYIENGTYTAVRRRASHHCTRSLPEAMTLPKWGCSFCRTLYYCSFKKKLCAVVGSNCNNCSERRVQRNIWKEWRGHRQGQTASCSMQLTRLALHGLHHETCRHYTSACHMISACVRDVWT